MQSEEIMLIGEYKNFRSEKRFDVKNASNQDVAAILVSLSDFIEPFVYEFAGIDTVKVDSLINVGQGIENAAACLKSLKRDSLANACSMKPWMEPVVKSRFEGNSEELLKALVTVAESYALNQILKKANVAFKPPAANVPNPEMEKPEDVITFVGNCKGWFAVKKLSVDEKTAEWEVAGILAGINHTLVNKSLDFAGMKSTFSQAGRKSLGNVAAALSQADKNNPADVCKACENYGYKPYASPEMLTKAYPDIKPPKVKGRKPKA